MAGYAQRVVAQGEWSEDAIPEHLVPARASPDAQARQAEAELAQLVRTIEAEIIPRLMLAHRAPREAAALRDASDCLPPCADNVAEFARFVLAHEVPDIVARVHALRTRGLRLEAVYLHLLAPVARHLGDLWLADVADFTEVTVGLCRLQQALRELDADFAAEDARPASGRRALLLTLPGEQHSFGAQMVAQFFRRAGWDVCSDPVWDVAQLARLVRRESFDLVGLSVSRDGALSDLADAVSAIRRSSRNPRASILVGGALLLAHPDYVAKVGADATARDGRQAVEQAETLLGLMAKRR